MDIADKVRELLDKEKLYAIEVYEDEDKFGNPLVAIEIEGDWKHDHLRAKWLMKEAFGAERVSTIVTKEDGSDFYTAVHYFYIPKNRR